MMTAISSIIAYRSIPDLEERQERVLAVIRKNPGVSRNDLARALNMDPGNVSRRIVELRHSGQIRIVGRRRDRLTGRLVHTYEATQ